jgi:hypothetical protein
MSSPKSVHDFRNGNLNQLAYSLLLFIRDVAGGDLVDWIDRRLAEAQLGPAEGRLGRMQQSIIEPLAGVHGASHRIGCPVNPNELPLLTALPDGTCMRAGMRRSP